MAPRRKAPIVKDEPLKRRKHGKNDMSNKSKNVKTQPEEEHAEEGEADIDHSVLGGMSGGHRMTGDEVAEDDADLTPFKVPFQDKVIICIRHEHGDKKAQPRLIFTHGAGGGIANPATKNFMTGFSEEGAAVCFQGTMNLQNRVKTFHAVLKSVGQVEALGGRSMSARAAVMTAQESDITITALVLVSYPLVGGKSAERRDQILLDLPENVEVLFIIGSADSMCRIEQLNGVREKMTAKSWLIEVEGADHGMSIKDKKGVEALRKRTGALAALWLSERSTGKRFCSVRWNPEDGLVEVEPWEEGI